MEREFTFSFTQKEIEYILQVLSSRPIAEALKTYDKILYSINAQNNPADKKEE